MKVISIYELLGLIKDGKAPKKILYKGKILFIDDEDGEYAPTYNYYDKDGENTLIEGWLGQYINDEVEIIEDEFIDIEEIKTLTKGDDIVLANTINQLIENQKKIIERLKDGE